MKAPGYRAIITVIAIICLAAPFSAASVYAFQKSKQPVYDPEINLRVFDIVWNTIGNSYYDADFNGVDWDLARDEYRPQAMAARDERSLYGVLNRMLGSLHDNHTYVTPPSEMAERESQTYAGTGMIRGVVENRVLVFDVKPGSPAGDAGIRPGWIIEEWNGQHVDPEDLENERYDISAGQKIRLKMLDPGDREREITLVCRPYLSTPVHTAKVVCGSVLYIRFDEFVPGASVWLRRALALHRNARSIVFDFRNNHGGEVSEMLKCLNLLYARETVIGSYTNRAGRYTPLSVPGSGRRADRRPLAVLIENTTYSSAEIFASAIQETGRGRVTGRKSVGVVLFSLQRPLPDGGQLQTSVRDYHTIGGRRIEGEGVTPDTIVPQRLEDLRKNIDLDLRRAAESLSGACR